jgi:hypothetical protein
MPLKFNTRPRIIINTINPVFSFKKCSAVFFTNNS